MGSLQGIMVKQGFSFGFIVFLSIIVVVVPIMWRLLKEGMSIHLSSKKQKLDRLFEVLGENGVEAHPLSAELAFREYFSFRLNLSDIEVFLKNKNPLFNIINYKYGCRYLEREGVSFHLTRNPRILSYKSVFFTLVFITAMLTIAGSLFFAIAAIATGQNFEVITAGFILIVAMVFISWTSLDEIRAINSAKRLADGTFL